ncbi:MobH family relaxase [Gilvimarinus agarilyticus]|uniref:MobH family relaxase n=1 Tax=Gilvimarinus agarilyticus TaxID=679259 RepID=UPI0006991502|nr:MobH family relaxase [Gilvimarinus agarilyticus]
MLNALKNMFTKGAAQRPGLDFGEEIPRYPPSAKGFPVEDLDKLLESQAELIQKLRIALGFTKDEHESLIMPVIRRYAEFVHLLPASEAHHHRGAGGLFRHGLEVGFWVAQISESVIYSMEGSPRERRNNEPRWRLASCFAGIMHDVGKPLSDVSVTDKDGTSTWNPYSGSLYEWADENKLNRYYLRWREGRHKRHERFSLLAVERIIPQQSLQYLSDAGPEIVEAMLEAIAGTGVNQPVTKLMLKADRISVSQDLKQSRLDVDEFSYGVLVERYVFDAIRRLVKSGKWKVNERGAKVWNLRNGVFIQWRNIGDLHELLEADQIPGIPRDPDTLADILIERGFAIPNNVTSNGSPEKYRYWEICPAELQPRGDAEEVKILGLRFESSDLVFTNEPPPPVEGVIIGEAPDRQEQDQAGPEDSHGEPRNGEKDHDVLTEQIQDDEEPVALSDDAASSDVFSPATKPGTRASKKPRKPNSGKANSGKAFSAPAKKNKTTGILTTVSAETGASSPTQGLSPVDRLERKLANCSEHTKTAIKLVIEPVITNKAELSMDGDLFMLQGRPAIWYPKGIKRCLDAPGLSKDDEKSFINGLDEDGGVEEDHMIPGRKIQNVKGARGVVLSPGLTAIVSAAVKSHKKQINQASKPEKQGKPKDSAPVSKKEDQPSNVDEGQKLPPRSGGKDKNIQEPKSKDTAAKNRVQHSSATKSSSKNGESAQVQLDLPRCQGSGKDVPSAHDTKQRPMVKPRQKPSKRPEITHEESEKDQARRIKDNRTVIDRETIFPETTTPDECIEQLKKMMLAGRGRWLSSAVRREGNFLIVGDKSLDNISGYYPEVSLRQLRQCLALSQKKPRLTMKENKLRLEINEADTQ